MSKAREVLNSLGKEARPVSEDSTSSVLKKVNKVRSETQPPKEPIDIEALRELREKIGYLVNDADELSGGDYAVQFMLHGVNIAEGV